MKTQPQKTQPIITAYAWKSGRIEFTTPVRRKLVPEGALPICTGPAKIVKEIVSVCARLAYDNKTLLVPGLPEIELTGLDPLKVFYEWRKWVCKRPGLQAA